MEAVSSHTEALVNRDILAEEMKEGLLKDWRYWTPERLKAEMKDSTMLEAWRQAVWTSDPTTKGNNRKASEIALANILKLTTMDNGATAIEALKVEPTCYSPGMSCRGQWDAFAVLGDSITLKGPARWKLWKDGEGPKWLEHAEATVLVKDPHMAIQLAWWEWGADSSGGWENKIKIWLFTRVSHTCLEGRTLQLLNDRCTAERCTVKRPPARIAMVPSNEDKEATMDDVAEMEYSIEGEVPKAGLIAPVGSEFFTEPPERTKRTLGEIGHEGWWTQLTSYLTNSRVRETPQGLVIMTSHRRVPNGQPALKECINEQVFYDIQFKAHHRISNKAHPSTVEDRVASTLEKMLGVKRADEELTMPKRYRDASLTPATWWKSETQVLQWLSMSTTLPQHRVKEIVALKLGTLRTAAFIQSDSKALEDYHPNPCLLR